MHFALGLSSSFTSLICVLEGDAGRRGATWHDRMELPTTEFLRGIFSDWMLELIEAIVGIEGAEEEEGRWGGEEGASKADRRRLLFEGGRFAREGGAEEEVFEREEERPISMWINGREVE